MGAFTIPRHGSVPSNIAPGYPPGSKLPGAINVAFYDGHVETVQLEKLWNLSWHRDYQAPAKRPGSLTLRETSSHGAAAWDAPKNKSGTEESKCNFGRGWGGCDLTSPRNSPLWIEMGLTHTILSNILKT